MMQENTDFPGNVVWLNSERALLIARELKGRVVVLHFWSRWNIHCLHTLREIEMLRGRFADAPVVFIGVHANEIEDESLSGLKAALERHDIRHPVIGGAGAAVIWENYGITMWPSFVLIGADGLLVGTVSGEGHGKLLEHNIDRALRRARDAGALTDGPIATPLPVRPDTPLRFPTKILVDQNRLAVVDSLHHRILVGELYDDRLRVTHTVGSGQRGAADGALAEATFNAPQGAAIRGDILWVADTGNHLVRRIDLREGRVATVLGTGSKLFDHEAGKSGRQQPLNSPWDLAVHANRLYISQAGQHQIFAMNLMTGATEVAAGTAREDLRDGAAQAANLAQPAGLALDPATQTLYFVDVQSSSLRTLDLQTKTVRTLIGEGLFDSGDIDGSLATARLKYPFTVTFVPPHTLLIADTGNHKIKRVDLSSGTIAPITIPDKLLEPAGVAAVGPAVGPNDLLIADTGNHRLLRLDPATARCREIHLIRD